MSTERLGWEGGTLTSGTTLRVWGLQDCGWSRKELLPCSESP